MRRSGERLALGAFLVASVLAGGNAVGVRFSNRELAPLFGAAFALAYYGFVDIHAGLGQTLLAIVPLVTLLLAVLQRQERFRAAGLAGAVLALVGIAVLSRAPVREAVPLLSFLALLGSALCFAQAAIVVRRFPAVHPVTMNAVAMGTSAVLLVGGSFLVGETIELPERGATWAAF